jgi:hypothetical protein
MQWLPRLTIYRNPLERMHFSARDRGTLLRACLEQLSLGGLSEDELMAAVREVLCHHAPCTTDRTAVRAGKALPTHDGILAALVLASVPVRALSHRRGVSELSLLAAGMFPPGNFWVPRSSSPCAGGTLLWTSRAGRSWASLFSEV